MCIPGVVAKEQGDILEVTCLGGLKQVTSWCLRIFDNRYGMLCSHLLKNAL